MLSILIKVILETAVFKHERWVFMWEWDIFEALYTITMLPSDRTTLTTGIYKEEKRIRLKNEQQPE